MHTIDYDGIIAYVRRKIERGESRISESPGLFQQHYWPHLNTQSRLFDFESISELVKQIENDVYEELWAIQEALDATGYKPPLTSWHTVRAAPDPKSDRYEQELKFSEASERMHQGLAQKASAIAVWDAIAVPLRRQGEFLHRVIAPLEAMGAPGVQTTIIDNYVTQVSQKTAEDRVHIKTLESQLVRWRAATIVLAIIAGFAIFA